MEERDPVQATLFSTRRVSEPISTIRKPLSMFRGGSPDERSSASDLGVARCEARRGKVKQGSR